MFKWFGKQLWKMQEKRAHGAAEGEAGFTLIELLVVVIIIGVLAAIAIPVYLKQRDKAYDAQAKSDVRNMATAEESYLTGHNTYTNDVALLQDEGFSESGNTSGWAATADGSTSYCVQATSQSDTTFHMNSGGTPQEGGC